LRCASAAAPSELSTGILSADQISQRDMPGRLGDTAPGSCSSVATIALPLASCPVTIRRTLNAIVDPPPEMLVLSTSKGLSSPEVVPRHDRQAGLNLTSVHSTET